MDCQSNDMIWWSGPKHQAVTSILESRLNPLVFQPQQNLINDQFPELSGQELLFLLGISSSTMRRVQRLDFGLRSPVNVRQLRKRKDAQSPNLQPIKNF